MLEHRYKEALKQSEKLSQEIIQDPDGELAQSMKADYVQRKSFLQRLNTEKAWLSFLFRANRAIIIQGSSIAAACLLAFFLLWDGRQDVVELAQNDIPPAQGVVAVRLASGELIPLDSLLPEGIGDAILDKDNNNISYHKASEISPSGKASAKTTVATPEYHELVIPKGRSFSLVLSDGTRVWVNAETSIRYPTSFSSSERIVYLAGEALFEVTHDAQRPFTVVTAEQNIKVLGTRFNVKSYPDEDIVATTLVSGSVSISCNAKKERMLYPGEQLRFTKTDRSFTVEEVNTDIYTSWTENKLVLQRTTLNDITNRLQRRYEVTFKFADEDLKKETFTGEIPLNDNLQVILRQLSRVSSARFEIQDGLVIIKNK